MRIRFNVHCLLISALLFSVQLCRAQTNFPGSVVFNLGTTDGTQLWDLSGIYSLNLVVNQRNGLQVPLQLGFNLVQDAAGNLHSPPGDTVGLVLQDDNTVLTVQNYTITGKVTGSGGAARARFTIRMSGNGFSGALTISSFTAILVVDAQPNSEDGQLEGVAKFSARFSNGLESLSGTIPDFTTALPPGVDGTWTLTVVATSFNSLSGIAVVTTPSRSFGFNLDGPFNPATADFNCKLRGSSSVPGVTISGVGSNGSAEFDTSLDLLGLNGKFMGQSIVISPD